MLKYIMNRCVCVCALHSCVLLYMYRCIPCHSMHFLDGIFGPTKKQTTTPTNKQTNSGMRMDASLLKRGPNKVATSQGSQPKVDRPCCCALRLTGAATSRSASSHWRSAPWGLPALGSPRQPLLPTASEQGVAVSGRVELQAA